jgi:hypothetical protein
VHLFEKVKANEKILKNRVRLNNSTTQYDPKTFNLNRDLNDSLTKKALKMEEIRKKQL